MKFMVVASVPGCMAEEYECDCGATFETEAELERHAREEHDADV